MKNVAVIGLGLIGSSVCRALKGTGKYTVYGYDKEEKYRRISEDLHFCHKIFDSVQALVSTADIVVLATPISTYGSIFTSIVDSLKQGSIVTDVGSVKCAVIEMLKPHIPKNVHFIPGHPIAGTEKSGPTAGIKTLFQKRFTILCPLETSSPTALGSIKNMWEDMGAMVDIMTPYHHDMVLAITSHIPHLLAFSLVSTLDVLEKNTETNVSTLESVKYSAGGFRDATRVAASSPEMWRDIFLNNKVAVLQFVELFERELQILKKAIKNHDSEILYKWFKRAKEIRLGIVEMGQAEYPEGGEQKESSLFPYKSF